MTYALFLAISTVLLWPSAWAQTPPPATVLDQQPSSLQPHADAQPPAFGKKKKKIFSAVAPSLRAREIRGNQVQLARTATRSMPFRLSTALTATNSVDHAKSQPDKIIYGKRTHLPIFIEHESPNQPLTGPTARTSMEASSYEFLEQVKQLMHIRQPSDEFVIRSVSTDTQGEKHIRMQQQYRGITLYGSEIVLHTQKNQLRRLSGRYQATPTLPLVEPVLTKQQAIAAAISHVKAQTTFQTLKPNEREFLEYDQPTSELVIYRPNQATAPSFVWHLTLRPNVVEQWEYFVDAQRGDIVDAYNHTCHIDGPGVSTAADLSGTPRQIHTYETQGFDYLIDTSRPMFDAAQSSIPDKAVGAIVTLDARNSPYTDMDLYYVRSLNDEWEPTAVSAHYNASVAYEYYQMTHQRNSINGQGGRILSIINVSDEDGADFGNAAWNGAAMLYGNGDRTFSSLARSLDVAGHEMTHGVIASTANLEYRNESGAINESMADVFGVLIEREIDDWQLGEDVVNRDVYVSGALRDMSDPHNGGSGLGNPGFQPKHLDEFYTGPEDNGGVHINSGIANHAFYLFATNEAVGLEKAEQIYYQALTNYLTPFSQFVDLRIAIVQSVGDLYGAEGAEVAAAQAAFDAVGITEGEGTEQQPDLPTATGDEFILSYDVNPDDENTLYLSDTEGINFEPKSTTIIKRKPSITDDGTTVLFVSEDSNIRRLSLVGDPNETIIQDEAVWDNVALSKDGTKLAAITVNSDTSVYVYDFVTEQWAKFRLYNPSFTEGVTTGEVLYADALEWDYSGEYLMYDAFNKFSSPDGSDLEYWDVGFMRVWNNETETFGDGDIEKLFSSLPEGVSIGNPSFSKNSPNVVAFDYANLEEDEYSLLAADFATGDVQTVFDNTQIGYPNYSVADDKLVFDGTTEDGQEVIRVIDLQDDKISPANTSAPVLIGDGKWAIWFAQGDRNILSSEKEMTAFSFEDLVPVTQGEIDGLSILVTVPDGTDLTQLVASFEHSRLSTVKIGEVEQNSGVTVNDFSQPLTYSVVAEDGSSQDYTVEVQLDQATSLSNAKDITAFSFDALNPPAPGTITEDSIIVFVPEGTNVSSLAATYTHSEGSLVRVGLVRQESGVSINDFTNPVTYTVIAENQSRRSYTVVAREDPTTGLADELVQQAVMLYPNPVSERLTLVATRLPATGTAVRIIDTMGKVVKQLPWVVPHGSTQQKEVTVSDLPAGIYTAQILLGQQFVTRRFVKQ